MDSRARIGGVVVALLAAIAASAYGGLTAGATPMRVRGAAAPMHDDDGILTVLSVEATPGGVDVTASLVYSEDKHPVDDATVDLVVTASTDPAGAPLATAAMPFTGTPGTYSAEVALPAAGDYVLTIKSAEPRATVTQPYTASQPASTQPATSQPVSTQPATSQPATTQPATSRSGGAEISQGVAQTESTTEAGGRDDGGSSAPLAIAFVVAALGGVAGFVWARNRADRRRAHTGSD